MSYKNIQLDLNHKGTDSEIYQHKYLTRSHYRKKFRFL